MRGMALAATGLLLVLGGAQPVAAGPIGFAVANDSKLYSIDVTSGAAAAIGPLGFFPEGLAMSPSGQLFGTSLIGNLYQVSSVDGSATLIGDTGLGDLEGLDFMGGTLVASDDAGAPTFFALDLTNATPTTLVKATSATGRVSSLAISAPNTALIHGQNDSSLLTVDLTTGATTSIATGVPDFFGLDFASDGMLYGLSRDGLIFRVNPSDGSTIQVADTGDQFWLGLAAAPAAIPEPSSFVLLALGVGGTLALRRRRE